MADWRQKSIDEHPLFIKAINILKSPVGYGFILAFCAALTYIITKMGFKIGLILTVAPLGIILALAAFFNAKAGIVIIITLAFFVFHLKRMVYEALPFGAMVEAFVYITVIGILFTKYRHKKDSWAALNHPFTYIIGALFLFFLIQLFNPNMHSVNGWLFGMRKLMAHTLVYFIMIFAFDEKKFFKNFINLWLFLSFLAGLYGCFQEWVGYTSFEKAYIFSSEHRLALIFIDGHFRKFSFLSDPSSYGVAMSLSSVFCIIQIIGPTSYRSKFVYAVFAIFMLIGMSYSGTRTAYATIPASLLLFSLMTINNKNTLIAAGLLSAGMLFLLFGPIQNGTIDRIRSTFEADDPSLNVRDVNRAMIQPYMYEHPIGGGVMTSGTMGVTYNPQHELAGFPPDSAYVRQAIEGGYIGLFFGCLFFFIILRVAIIKFYRTKDERVRYYYLGFAALFYAVIIAEYAQEVSGQMPTSFIFYAFLGFMVKLDKVGV